MKKSLVILILWLLSVVPVQAQCPDNFCIYLPIVESYNPCMENGMSDWKIVIPESTINKVLNPSAEIAGNFAAVGGTATRVTTYQHYSPYSYRVVTAADNQGMTLTLNTLANAIHYVTVRVRGTLPPAWDWSLDNATYTAPTLLEQIDSNWALYGLQFPAAQANGSTTLYIYQNGAGAGDFYLDGIQVEEKEYWTTYCDGTQEGCEWLGTPHGATSQRSANSRAGGRLQDLEDDYYLNIGGMSGTGTAPQDLSIDEYAILPGGELSNIKIDSRVFTLTGVINGTSQADFHDKKRTLFNALSPDAYPEDENGAQPVRLQYQGATVHKQISVHYEGGLQGELSATDPCAWEQVAVRFAAPNPYWEEIGESVAILDTEDSATFRNVSARLRSTGQWDALGPPNVAGGPYQGVRAIAEDANYIYMVGNFDNFDNIANADNAVRYDKQSGTYSAMGTGLNGTAFDTIVGSDGLIYVGGSFTTAGGGAANYIASWNPTTSTWAALGAGTDNTVNALTIGLDGLIYVGGQFANAGGAPAAEVASWNPDTSTWAALGAGTDDTVNALATGIDGLIYVGGRFLNAGGASARYIASWNPDTSTWAALDTGFTGGAVPKVDTIAIGSNGLVYAGGVFTSAGTLTVNNVAVWNGNFWADMNGGANEEVFHLSIAPDDILYAVGNFSSIGGITLTDRIARWNGYTWAHVDIDFSGTPFLYYTHHSQPDPVISTLYDVWIGSSITATGDYGGLVAVNNEGSVAVFPKIIFYRSGGTGATIATLSNERTGKELLFDYALLDGETLTIDLAETKKSIVSSVFGGRQDAILPNSDFGDWSLLIGNNDVTSFVIATGGSTVTAYMLWKDNYSSQD